MNSPDLERYSELVQFRAKPSVKEEFVSLAGEKDMGRWLRWGMEQALEKLREINSQQKKENLLETKAS